MLKLYFGSVFSTISTLLVASFAVFFTLIATRRVSITHWGTFALILFFLGLAMSVMSGMKDGIGTASSLIPTRHWLMTALCALGGLAFLVGVAALIIRNQGFWQAGFYALSGIIILKTILTEAFRIAQFVKR